MPAAVRADTLVFWNGHGQSDDARFLLDYCEQHAERLRARYCAWVHDVGETRIAGRRVVDHLTRKDGLSLWWMTLLAEKNLWKSPTITDAIKLMALEEMLACAPPAELRLASGNRDLHEAVRGLCDRLDIEFAPERIPHPRSHRTTLRSLYRSLPHPVRAVGALVRYAAACWPLRTAERDDWFGGDSALFICSYFSNLEPSSCESGRFRSRYWVGLHALLPALGLNPNWLQIYHDRDGSSDAGSALDCIRRFNDQRDHEGFHVFLQSYLSWSVVARVARRWLRFALLSWRLRKITNAFRPRESHVSFWPIMRRDWYDSLRGATAINSLISIELFDDVLRAAPHQRRGLYLCENQAWERALIHAWRKHGHGQLVAVPHATRSFWDLRFAFDPRTVSSQEPNALPRPDITAANGAAALSTFSPDTYASGSVTQCEALRYGYLSALRARPEALPQPAPLRVLILGDYFEASTTGMLRLLEAAVGAMTVPASFVFKSHPQFAVSTDAYPGLSFQVATEPLPTIIGDFDVAFSSNRTSAAVDAYVAGLPVVVMLDEGDLNLSPLRGARGVQFVGDRHELARALQTVDAVSSTDNRSNFFFLDPELPRWRRLLQAKPFP